MLNENHNSRILNLITHWKIIFRRPTKNILYLQRETQRATAQILKDVDDYCVYLAKACYTMKD